MVETKRPGTTYVVQVLDNTITRAAAHIDMK